MISFIRDDDDERYTPEVNYDAGLVRGILFLLSGGAAVGLLWGVWQVLR